MNYDLFSVFSNYIPVFILGIAVIIVFRIIISGICASKLDTALDEKEAPYSIFGLAFTMGIFFGLAGLAVSALIVIAVPDHSSLISFPNDQG